MRGGGYGQRAAHHAADVQPYDPEEENEIMPLMPFAMLWIWLRGLCALALLGGGLWLLYTWYEALSRTRPVVQTDLESPSPPAPPLSTGAHRPLAPRLE